MTPRSLARPLLLTATLFTACASTPPRTAERPQRVSDSAPDKIAATRAAAGLHLEADDQRWGIEEARARKQGTETHQVAAPPPRRDPVQ